MSEQLQHLIDRIRTEGVGKADTEAQAILEKARLEAARLEREALDRAAVIVKKAEADAAAHAERGRKALEQASRDTILTVRQTLEALFDKVFRRRVETALTPEAFQAILRDVITAYLAQGHGANGLDITVPAGREDAVRNDILKTFQAEAAAGVTIRSSNDVIAGFRVSFVRDHVEHDFSPEAIAETLARLVRPDLGALLKQAAAGDVNRGTPAP
jgi:V/A-type H+-transporting ATPase subunit E